MKGVRKIIKVDMYRSLIGGHRLMSKYVNKDGGGSENDTGEGDVKEREGRMTVS